MEIAERRQKMTWHHYGVVITMMLVLGIVVSIIFAAAGLCYRPVAEHFNVQVSDVSLYMTFIYIGSMIGPIPAGYFFSHYNPKVVCSVASLMVIVPYAGFAFYPAIWCYWVAGFIIGCGLVCIEFTMTAGVLSRWFHTNYGFVNGLCFAMTGLGGIIWNLVGQMVLGPDLSGWQTLYMIYTVLLVVGSLPGIILFVRRTPEECGTHAYGVLLDENGTPISESVESGEDKNEPVEARGYTAKEARRFPFFWTMLIGCALMNAAAIFTFMFSTYVQWLGHDGWGGAAIVALLMLSGTLESCASGGQMLGKVLIGWIESKKLIAAPFVGLTGGIVGILLMWIGPLALGENGIILMFIGGVLYGLQYACTNALIPFMIREVFGSKDYEKIYSIQLVAYNLVGAFAATAWALVEQSAGWQMYFIVGILVLTIGDLLLIYTIKTGLKKRSLTWYVSDEQLLQEERERLQADSGASTEIGQMEEPVRAGQTV
ncbi:MAG: MFS transporter [Eggerthellaceae bacterium]|jgi:OFA family oxalate/formate antiporter-like MFS transporter